VQSFLACDIALIVVVAWVADETNRAYNAVIQMAAHNEDYYPETRAAKFVVRFLRHTTMANQLVNGYEVIHIDT
jgi:hypothetical protein